MEDFQPYIKYILYLIAILGFLFVNRIFVQNIELRRWIMQSFEDSETKRASGRALSAFSCTFALLIGWFIAIHYGENHTAPEYYYWGLLGLITSLYGIKEVGKVMTSKYTNGSGSNGNVNGNGQPPQQPTDTEVALKKKWEESGSELTFEEWKKTQIQ